jgi:serine phosphatase RsbU (regulator of sigma subunit)
MAPETFLPVMYFATGALMFAWGLGLLRRFGQEELHRVTALMLMFAGVAPILAGIGLVQPSSAEARIFLFGGYLDRFSYLWEFFFPTILYFSLIFPRRHPVLNRFPWLRNLLYLPYIVHLVLILTARRVEPSTLLGSLESSPKFLSGHLSILDTLWSLGTTLHALIFPAINLLVGLAAIFFLARNPLLKKGEDLRRQKLFLVLGLAFPMSAYLIAEALPIFMGRVPSAIVRPHLLSASVILSSAVIAYATIRYRFLRIRMLARRGILDVSVSLILAIVYLFLLERTSLFFGTYFGSLAALFEAGLTVLAFVLFQPLVSRVESLMDRRLFGHSGDPRRESLRQLAASLGKVSWLGDVEDALTPILREPFHIDNFSLHAWDCPRQEGGVDPGWFRKMSDQRARLLEADGPLGWLEFRSWCLQNNLPMPPADSSFKYVLPASDGVTCRGLILLGGRSDRRGLRGVDREHLVLLAGQIASALRNLSLLAELLDKRILEEELQLAQRIQSGLLPREKPDVDGIELHGLSLPSRQVGGDYYDWIEKGADLYFIIADVSGKGIPAAMLMATLQASFRSLVRNGRSPGDILSDLNQTIFENSPSDRFITLWLGRLRIESGRLEYASAGHPAPLLTRGGGMTVPLQEGGVILGAFAGLEFASYEIPFGEGDRLVCYTDGVSETINAQEEQFSDRRLVEVLGDCDGDPQQVIDNLMSALNDFSASGEPDDDCTLLVIQGCDGRKVRSDVG